MSEQRRPESNQEPLANEVSELGLHDKEMREIAEPYEALVTGPKWFYLFIVFSAIIAAFYLGRHMGQLDVTAHIGFPTQHPPADTKNGTASPQVSGEALFTSKCVSCHQADGKGIPGVFPPLDQSEYVVGPPDRLISIVLRGLTGPIEVEGNTFNGLMPAWAGQMNDAEIAAVITHIRQKLGSNHAEAIEPDAVANIRQATEGRDQPWTFEELKATYP